MNKDFNKVIIRTLKSELEMSKSEAKSNEDRNEVYNKSEGLRKVCPACGLQTTMILDPKKQTEQNKLYICLTCGHVFEVTQKEWNS